MRNKVGDESGTPKQLTKKIKLWKNYKEYAPVVIKITVFLDKNQSFSVLFDLIYETKNMQDKFKQSSIIKLWRSININAPVLIKIKKLKF